MEHFSSENLTLFLLAGFSGLDLFRRGLIRVFSWYKEMGRNEYV